MAVISEQLLANGIRLRSYEPGDHRTTCPQCSAARKKKSDPCLSVTIDSDGGAVWQCHHCNWSDGVSERQEYRPRRREKPVRPNYRPSGLPQIVVDSFAKRGIGKAVLERNAIGHVETWMPGCKDGEKANAVAFPYRRNGEVVNVKYRASGKRFRQEKNAEKVLYGIDDIAGCEEVIIVEGEIDKLSLEEAGYRNCVSVPDGAPQQVSKDFDRENDRKFQYVWNCKAELDPVKKIIIATDGDGPGQALAEELARRLGRERCWRVEWPALNDAPRKDANEVLVNDGAEVLKECIREARPYPIRSLHGVGEYRGSVLALYHHGRERAHSTGWASLDPLFTIREGELSIVTGVPGAGKSEFVDALMCNLADKYGWRFAVCSFENPPDEHLSKLVEKRLGMPFWDGPRPRMGEVDLNRALDWATDHFSFIRADDEAPTLDWILEAARSAVLRHGIRGLVIDPYNEIEHRRPSAMSETEYVSQSLGKVRRFAAGHDVHVWFIAHPAKMYPEGGVIPAPTLYSISGSAHFINKADLGIVVHRDPEKYPPETEIHVRKVRFKSVGRIGQVTLGYDPATGRYSDQAPAQQYRADIHG